MYTIAPGNENAYFFFLLGILDIVTYYLQYELTVHTIRKSKASRHVDVVRD